MLSQQVMSFIVLGVAMRLIITFDPVSVRLQPKESDVLKPVAGNPKPFSDTYHEIPNLLPQKMAENLSVALAFAALLHLANENSLHLEQNYGNLNDFVIVHPE